MRKTTVTLPFSYDELMSRTDRFAAEGGEWRCFQKATYTLAHTIDHCFKKYEPVYPYPGFDKQEAYDLLINHLGLTGEFGNGLAIVIEHYLINDDHLQSRDKSIREVITGFNSKSEIMNFPIADRLGIENEKKRQVFTRLGNDIEAWINVNHDLPAEDLDRVRGCLKEYRAGLQKTLDYIDYAEGYFKQIDTQAPKIMFKRGRDVA